MPKVLPDKARFRAMELFLRGDKSAKTIAENVSTEFSVKVRPPTIYAWAKKYNWKAKKTETEEKGIMKVQESESQRFAKLQTEHLSEYEEMRHKASHELNGLVFDRASDAAKVLDLSIQGERTVMEGMINLQFIQDVLSVILEEIEDKQLIDRIAIKLRTLAQQDKL